MIVPLYKITSSNFEALETHRRKAFEYISMYMYTSIRNLLKASDM